MAVTTVGDVSYIGVLGPFKMEVINITGAANGDTVVSKLANPSFAVCLPTEDLNTDTHPSAALSTKTVTIHDPPSANGNVVVIVFGDSIKTIT